MFGFTKTTMVSPTASLPGRDRPVLTPGTTFHEVLGTKIDQTPEGAEVAYFALGCFWGAEKLFWEQDGVLTTAVGYQGGYTPNPTYEEVCSGATGHAESVRVVFDPSRVSYRQLLRVFLENHDPTQGMRQGNDHGTQYRSILFVTDEGQRAAAEATLAEYQPETDPGRLRRDHHRGDRCRAVLLRGALPPGLPGQESGRVLPGARHRRAVPAGLSVGGVGRPAARRQASRAASFSSACSQR